MGGGKEGRSQGSGVPPTCHYVLPWDAGETPAPGQLLFPQAEESTGRANAKIMKEGHAPEKRCP